MGFETPPIDIEGDKKEEKSGADRNAELREVMGMESALRTIQADYQSRIPGGDMPGRIDQMINALHTKTVASPTALEHLKDDYKILEAQFTGELAPARFRVPAKMEAFKKIGAELEKVKVEGM